MTGRNPDGIEDFPSPGCSDVAYGPQRLNAIIGPYEAFLDPVCGTAASAGSSRPSVRHLGLEELMHLRRTRCRVADGLAARPREPDQAYRPKPRAMIYSWISVMSLMAGGRRGMRLGAGPPSAPTTARRGG
jgi:hypothetical protein